MSRQHLLRASLVVLCCGISLGAVCFAQDATQAEREQRVAVVGGQPIYEQDLISIAGANLLDLRKQEYKLKSDALNQAIRKKLVEVEAKKRGVSAEELLKQEIDSKIAEPSDDEAKGYYLALKNDTSLPFDQVKSQAKQLLRTAEIQQAREKYADSLRDKTEVSVLLQPPLIRVADDPSRMKGDPAAPITIIEFADFQCPFCNKAESVLKDVLAQYQDKVKLSYRDFPLSQIHPNAKIAAEASRCALDEGKYWPMHDAMFGDQSKLDQGGLVKTATALGMNRGSFEACLKSGKYEAAVQQDFQAGSDAGVNATPAFFINGEFLSGAQSEAEFSQIIERQLGVLAKASSAQASSR